MSVLLPSRVELIMANLAEALSMIEGVRTVLTEAPREDEKLQPFSTNELPAIWAWEEEESPAEGTMSALVRFRLPVTIECVYPYAPDTPGKGLRAVGRRWKALIQEAVTADPGRGFDPHNQASIAWDTIERVNTIAPLRDHCGVVHLEYDIDYVRAFDNPRDARPSQVPA